MFVTQDELDRIKAASDKRRYNTIEWKDEYLPIVVLAAGSIAAVAFASVIKKRRKRR